MMAKRLALLGLCSIGIAPSALALQFTITVENLGPQPFSPIFVASTNGNFDLFTAGSAAPLRIERIAEDGDASVAGVSAAGPRVAVWGENGSDAPLNANTPIQPAA